MAWTDEAKRLGELLRRSKRILFITGAGLSADSGLPTYRGIGGLYEEKDTADGMPIEQALSGETFQHAPEVTWRYLCQVERALRGATFNRGHEVIALVEHDRPHVRVLTQNIDGFHQAAGSHDVIEIHGNLRRLACVTCLWGDTVADYASFEADAVPSCPRCGRSLRPEVVLFGEALPDVATRELDRELQLGFDLLVSVGTTSVFPYIGGPVVLAAAQGVATVEVNPGETAVSRHVGLRVRARAAEALDLAYRHLRGG